jgi:hypothetical protein
MDALEAIKKRRSVRSYTGESIPLLLTYLHQYRRRRCITKLCESFHKEDRKES